MIARAALARTLIPLAAFSGGCRCGEPAKAPDVVYAVPAVTELVDARRAGTGFLVVNRAPYVYGDAIPRDEALLVGPKGILWRTPRADTVLLGDTAEDDILLIETTRPRVHTLTRFAPLTKTRTAVLELPVPNITEGAFHRSGDRLFFLHTVEGAPSSTFQRVDLRTHIVASTKQPGRLLSLRPDFVYPEAGAFGKTNVRLFCRPSEKPRDVFADLCRLSVDGDLLGVLAGPIRDVASVGEGAAVARYDVPRDRDVVERRNSDDAVSWSYDLAAGWTVKHLVADETRVVVLTSKTTSRQIWEDEIIALDGVSGKERWREASGAHGQHFQGPLLLAPRRVLFVANTSPNLRLFDEAGKLVWGGSLTTDFVVSTEVMGGFVEPLRGGAFLLGRDLLLARKEKGLEVRLTP